MNTLEPSAEQLREHVFRWAERREHRNHSGDPSIPAEAFAMVNPPLYLLLAHATAEVPAPCRPALVGAKGLSVALLEMSPGQKAPLHVHLRSREAFVCLRGRVKFRLGEHATEEVILAPFDMFDVPVGIYRDFQCADDEPALLLGIITDEREGDDGDIVIAPAERARFVARFGCAILDKLSAATGMHFTDPPGT
jgi:mannose-6-phosphate isomerase-like protein (cupin superfamily)